MSELVAELREADAKLTRWCESVLGTDRGEVSTRRLHLESADEIERLQAIVDAICDNAEYQGELSQVCTDEYTPTGIYVWAIPLSGEGMSLREAAEKARE